MLSPASVALLYAVLAVIWILASGALLTMSVPDPALQARVELGKGLLFVLLTSFLLYLILRAWEKRAAGIADSPAFSFIPLHWRIVASLLLVGLVPLAGVLVARIHGPQVERAALSNLGAIADLKADLLRNWLEERSGDGAVVMALPGMADLVAAVRTPGKTEGTREALRRQLMAVIGGLRYDTAALLDVHGKPFIEIGSYHALPDVLALVDSALATGVTQRAGLIRDVNGDWHFDLIVPLHSSENGIRKNLGVVVLHEDPERFLFPYLRYWPGASATGEILLFKRVDDILLLLSDPVHYAAAQRVLPETGNASGQFTLSALSLRGENTSGWTWQGSDHRGAMTVAALRPIPGTDWVLAAKLDRDEVMAPLHDVAFWVSLVTLLAISVVGAVMLLFWRQRSMTYALEIQAHSNRLMQQLYDMPFLGIAITSPQTRRWLKCNDRFCEIMGYPREELMNLSWRDLTSPDDMAISEIENERVLTGASDGFSLDKRFIRKDGSIVYASVDVRGVRRPDGSLDYILAVFQDVSERKAAEAREHRLTRTYAALSECNQLIVRCRDRAELFPSICRIAVELGGMKMAWVGMLDPLTGLVAPVASYGGGSEFLEGIVVSCDAQLVHGRGATGTCIRERRHVWIEDFQNDPMTAPWHDLGRGAGWAASCALPLEVDGAVVGAFMLYSGEQGAFDDVQRELLTEMAADISFALVNFAREEARQLAESKLSRLTQIYSALSECNQAIVRCNSEEELFPQICRFAVQYGGMKMAWIGLLDNGTRCIAPVASFGDGTDFLSGVRIPVDLNASSLSMGVTASCIRENKPFWIQDYLGDPRTVAWHAHARVAGWGGVAAFPLMRDGVAVGALTMYAKGVDAFDEQIRSLLLEMAKDISFALDLFRKEAQRRRMENQLQLTAKVFDQGGEGIMITDDQVNIITVNRAFELITGYTQEEVVGKNPRFLSSDRHVRDFYRAMWEAIHSGGFWQGEVWNRRKDGDIYPEYLSVSRVTDAEGRVTNYVGTFNDISESKASQEHIQRLAHYDSLTGLPNRVLLADRVSLALSRMERSGGKLALVFLDLDRFKNVNDSLGHRIGDELLIQVAQRLKELLRDEDTVSRLGGDEFILVLPDVDEDGAGHVAGKVLKALSLPYSIEQYELAVTASMGIAMYPDDGTSYEALSMCADTAMYRAKQSGRHTFCFFTREMQERSDRTLLLENALRRTLELEQLQLHFQPQVSLENGRVVGVEALLRWTHPELGEIVPADFIPVAEDSGMILPIGEWVLRSAVRQMREWLDRGMSPLVMAVNLSAIQFRQANLPQLVSQILDEAGLPPGLLELELTEGVAMENPLEAIAVMNDLYRRGVRMSIDDFGTGYSSLSYLKRFKVYKLKIDKSFVRDISRDPEDEAIVEAIIGLAESLGMQTIAEGVETNEQSAFLRAKGCHEGQGYLYSRPMPAAEFERYARASGASLYRG